MELFQKALTFKRSTIIYGHYGRYPSLVQFYLNSISELEPASDYELIFWYRPNLYESRLLHVLIEPSFDEVIPSNIWTIVLSSHLQLFWNPLTTRVVKCEKDLNISQPIKSNADQIVVIPSTSHVYPYHPIFQENDFNKSIRIDMSTVNHCHEAYLKLLTVFDLLRPSTVWSLSIPIALRQSLLKKLKPQESKYDKHILQILNYIPIN